MYLKINRGLHRPSADNVVQTFESEQDNFGVVLEFCVGKKTQIPDASRRRVACRQ